MRYPPETDPNTLYMLATHMLRALCQGQSEKSSLQLALMPYIKNKADMPCHLAQQSLPKDIDYHDEDLLRTSIDPLLCLLGLMRVWHTEPDSMSLAALHIAAALVDSIEWLLLTAAQLDAAELSTAGNLHEQLWQACWAGGVAHGHHGLEADVVASHQLAWDHGFQCKPILIRPDLQQNLCC